MIFTRPRQSWLVAGAWSLVLTVATTAQQADRARTEALVARATARMRALEREADLLAADERTLLGDLRKLEVDRQLKTEELARLDAENAQVEADREATTTRIESLEAEIVATRPALRARLIEIYKLGRARYARLLPATSDL